MRIAKKCLTIANVKCGNGKEIDLLAVDSQNKRFHIEVTISTSDMFSKITDKKITKEDIKAKPGKKSPYRRTMDFFINDKFNDSNVLEGLKEFGFKGENYRKVIVSGDADTKARARAKTEGIELWCMPDLLKSLFLK